MKRSGIVSAVLAGVFVLGIAGCDDSPSGNGFSGSKIEHTLPLTKNSPTHLKNSPEYSIMLVEFNYKGESLCTLPV